MSGQNRLINSVFQNSSESALTSALENANNIAAEEMEEGKTTGTHDESRENE